MLTIGQRAKLIDSIPTELSDYTLKKLRRDRLGNDDYEFPSMRIAILSQGIRSHPSTAGPTRKDRLGYQGDVRQWLGEYQRATISLTVLCESETAITDQETPETLDQILYDLQQEISIWRLGLKWSTDLMKVLPGSMRVTYLPPIMSHTTEHWIYPANLDFTVEYEFSVLDPTPNIHAIAYDWSIPCESGTHFIITDYHPPCYGMGISVLGWKSEFSMDVLLNKISKEKSYSMDMILISD